MNLTSCTSNTVSVGGGEEGPWCEAETGGLVLSDGYLIVFPTWLVTESHRTYFSQVRYLIFIQQISRLSHRSRFTMIEVGAQSK